MFDCTIEDRRPSQHSAVGAPDFVRRGCSSAKNTLVLAKLWYVLPDSRPESCVLSPVPKGLRINYWFFGFVRVELE